MRDLTHNAVEQAVLAALGADYANDRVQTELGWVCRRGKDTRLGPSYLCAFNYPTEINEIDYISQFTGEANIDLVDWFYRQTNGMRLMADHFVVPGVRFTPEGLSLNGFRNVALDLDGVSGPGSAPRAPVSGLLIGASFRHIDGQTQRLRDILTSSGEVIGGFFIESSEILDRFPDILVWLKTRIPQAIAEFEKARQRIEKEPRA